MIRVTDREYWMHPDLKGELDDFLFNRDHDWDHVLLITSSGRPRGGKTMLATLKPTTLLAMFNTPQLAGVAQEVEDTIAKIMKEAASG